MNRLASLLSLVLLAACAGPSGMVAHATSSGSGDVRTDGQTIVVLGNAHADLGVRTATGLPVFLVPPVPLERDQWYVLNRARGFERTAPITEPLPWWTRDLYLPADLELLLGMGLPVTFEPMPPLPTEP